MPHKTIILLAALLTLTACNVSKPAGAHLEPPQENLTAPCPHPTQFLGTKDWEIIAGRIGDALIICNEKHAALSDWTKNVAGAVGR